MDKFFELLVKKVSLGWVFVSVALAIIIQNGPAWITALRHQPDRVPKSEREKDMLVDIAKQCLNCGKCKFTFTANKSSFRTIEKTFGEYPGFAINPLLRVPANSTPLKSIGDMPETVEFPVLVEPAGKSKN